MVAAETPVVATTLNAIEEIRVVLKFALLDMAPQPLAQRLFTIAPAGASLHRRLNHATRSA
jgi:hypothetical protein